MIWSIQNGSLYATRNFSDSIRTIDFITLFFKSGIGGSSYFIAPFSMNQSNSEELSLMRPKGIWYTPDFGDHWSPIDTMANLQPYAGLITDFKGSTFALVGGRFGKLARYDDVTFNETSIPFMLSDSAPNGLKNAFIKSIIQDPIDSSALYVSFSSVSKKPRVWKIKKAFSDTPKWKKVSGDLPKYLPANCIAASASDPKKLAIETDYGVYTTTDGGKHWQRDMKIPNVVVFQIKIRETDNKLFAFTHGRGAWMADFTDEVSSTDNKPISDMMISIYPNPTTNLLHIKSTNVIFNSRYSIYDVSGKLFLSGRLVGKEHSITVSDLEKGMYFIRFYNGNDLESSQSFIKF